MFRNRWFALLFVGMVLAGVTKIVGTEEDQGALDAAREELARQRAQAEQMTGESAQFTFTDEDVEVEFVPDEELIDPATGYDPTPIDEFAAASETGEEVVPDAQVVIVQHNDGQRPGQ